MHLILIKELSKIQVQYVDPERFVGTKGIWVWCSYNIGDSWIQFGKIVYATDVVKRPGGCYQISLNDPESLSHLFDMYVNGDIQAKLPVLSDHLQQIENVYSNVLSKYQSRK